MTPPAPIDPDLSALIADALSPPRFFVAPGSQIHLEHLPTELTPWEFHNGHLIPAAQCRRTEPLESWNLILKKADDPPGPPIVSVHHHHANRQIFITRSIRLRAGELRELIATLHLERIVDIVQLSRLLGDSIGLALTGTRLPITSHDSPHPAFVFGQLAYENTLAQPARALEVMLRSSSVAEMQKIVNDLNPRTIVDLARILKTLFNQLALSPYTSLVDNLVAFLRSCMQDRRLDAQTVVDILGYMLRHLVRHLNAFDLVKFHNMGADYPDALMLDALLQLYLEFANQQPDLFEDATRRRALRQAWLFRKRHEGHKIPDAPTSPGENLRLLPAPFVPVPDHQLADPSARRKTLFTNVSSEDLLTPITRSLLEQSIADLSRPSELEELGRAVFLDRPLGVFKPPGHPDRTPLISYDAFSRSIANARLSEILRLNLLTSESHAAAVQTVRDLAVLGIPLSKLPGQSRQGAPALEDAKKVALDFIFTRTTRTSLDHLLADYDQAPLQHHTPDLANWLAKDTHVLLIRHRNRAAPMPTLIAYDAHMHPRIEFAIAPAQYIEQAGREYLENGLQVTRIWERTSPGDWIERDTTSQNLRLLPRI